MIINYQKTTIHGNQIVEENRKIIDEELGDTSFGYDSIFLSDDLGKTFGQATSDEKNSVSHRARALQQIKRLI